jgi:hypothetical protein
MACHNLITLTENALENNDIGLGPFLDRVGAASDSISFDTTKVAA